MVVAREASDPREQMEHVEAVAGIEVEGVRMVEEREWQAEEVPWAWGEEPD